ncbi:MAG: hypothetical protein HZA93_24685 [Verrucomicrobia bacterium]|nr:hypothetical protein [Verrucomicrobiota bacterium]
MNSSSSSGGLLARHFQHCYRQSLDDYRFFYDDITEIGNAATARHVFYFVPGINGTPGQMRFLLPSLTRVFGSQVYLKALHLPEFSARLPMWEKYSLAHVDRKIAQLRVDLHALLARFPRFAVLCSSNGFYDFMAAAEAFAPDEIESRIQLVWGACAPDHFQPSVWEDVFFPLNGFEHRGHRWWAYPNHNALAAFNPETSTSFHWRDGARPLFKADLESRFRCLGLQWCYTSPDQLGRAAQRAVAQIHRSWRAPAEALVAAHDGYWQGRPRSDIEFRIRRYLPKAHCEFRPDSHLWVVNPTNVTALFARLKPRLPSLHPTPVHAVPVPPPADSTPLPVPDLALSSAA